MLVALEILTRASNAVGQKQEETPEHLAQLLDFFKGFVDRCHHGKEEDVLFPKLVRRGMPLHGGPIAVMLSEHEAGRSHVRAMTDLLERLGGGDPAAAAAIQQPESYRATLQAHIPKENNILFPMADELVPEDVGRSLKARFDAIERDRIGAGKQNIKPNLFLAFGYNALGVPLAAGVLYPFLGLLLSPVVAAAAMSFGVRDREHIDARGIRLQ